MDGQLSPNGQKNLNSVLAYFAVQPAIAITRTLLVVRDGNAHHLMCHFPAFQRNVSAFSITALQLQPLSLDDETMTLITARLFSLPRRDLEHGCTFVQCSLTRHGTRYVLAQHAFHVQVMMCVITMHVFVLAFTIKYQQVDGSMFAFVPGLANACVGIRAFLPVVKFPCVSMQSKIVPERSAASTHLAV